MSSIARSSFVILVFTHVFRLIMESRDSRSLGCHTHHSPQTISSWVRLCCSHPRLHSDNRRVQTYVYDYPLANVSVTGVVHIQPIMYQMFLSFNIVQLLIYEIYDYLHNIGVCCGNVLLWSSNKLNDANDDGFLANVDSFHITLLPLLYPHITFSVCCWTDAL